MAKIIITIEFDYMNDEELVSSIRYDLVKMIEIPLSFLSGDMDTIISSEISEVAEV